MNYSHNYNSRRFNPLEEAKAADCVRNLSNWETAVNEIQTWPEYEPQPLRFLPNSAKQMRISHLYYKDESLRFGSRLRSFKALGAPYAIYCLLAGEVHSRTGIWPTSTDLRLREYYNITDRITVCVATDGNQGRGLAFGAHVFGCRCVVYIHNHVSVGRKEAIEFLGAVVIRVDGEYGESVTRAKEDARINGWYFVSSTTWDDFTTGPPRMVMNGYMVLVEEALSMIPEVEKITHVLICGGVGSIAAAVFLGFEARLKEARKQNSDPKNPRYVVIEPENADCLLQSSIANKLVPSTASLHTIMAGLVCRTPSPAAFKLLSWLASDFIAVPDLVAIDGMKALAIGNMGDVPIICGESSSASMGLMLLASKDDSLREKLGLDDNSRVVLFGCEGATDPTIYEDLTGMKHVEVFHNQAQYLSSQIQVGDKDKDC